MPNLCEYEMKIKGSKDAVQRVIDCLKADYDYEKGKPAHKHFFRVFDCYGEENITDNKDGTFTAWVCGDCAWAVNCCMISGYYEECKKLHPKIFMGTTLEEQSQDCEIEVFSEEPGCLFSEHYIYKNGECLCDDCIEIEVKDDNDEWEIINAHRETPDSGFAFAI